MTTPQRPNQTSTDALWQRWRKDNCADARRELLGRYLGLVHHAAREMAPRVRDAVSLEELVSAGSVGLLQAMAGFEPERGLAFSTFAMRRIRGAILDELRARDPLSRVDRLERPLLILHGTADVNVPYLHSVRLIDELLKKGKGDLVSFMTYPGEFHYFTREHVLKDAWSRVERFFAANLKGGQVESVNPGRSR